MPFNVVPECRYGHGRMGVAQDPDGSPVVFAAVNAHGNQINLGRAFTFHIYECPTCSYLEFHEWEPKKK